MTSLVLTSDSQCVCVCSCVSRQGVPSCSSDERGHRHVGEAASKRYSHRQQFRNLQSQCTQLDARLRVRNAYSLMHRQCKCCTSCRGAHTQHLGVPFDSRQPDCAIKQQQCSLILTPCVSWQRIKHVMLSLPYV